jgi:hypothetical protein
MNNVIEFPDKVFRQWGAVAQVLTPYLCLLGATTAEAREIISRMQVRWEELGVPLSLPALRSVPKPLPDRQDAATKGTPGEQAMQTSPARNPENARTMLEFARLEYQRSQAS